MTQAEFARRGLVGVDDLELGRGTAKPSRVAFKTILAFAEARRALHRAAARPQRARRVSTTLPVLRLKSRVKRRSSSSTRVVAARLFRKPPLDGSRCEQTRRVRGSSGAAASGRSGTSTLACRSASAKVPSAGAGPPTSLPR